MLQLAAVACLVFAAQNAACSYVTQAPTKLRVHRARAALPCMQKDREATSDEMLNVAMPSVDPGQPVANAIALPLSPMQEVGTQRPRRKKPPVHLEPGPIMLSWGFALSTMTLQALLTDWGQLRLDAEWCWGSLISDPSAQLLLHYGLLGACSLATSYFLMAPTFPATTEVDAHGVRAPIQVPRYKAGMKQHKLTAVDASYMALNAMCMPGLFYHYFCLMRSWGFDPTAAPLFGIYPADLSQLLLETLPQGAAAIALYFLTYEFIYYWWHRWLHESPAAYKWVHRHHHQQSYPDRGVVDTLNTGCVESQVGLYLQLGVLWACGQLGVANLPAGIWFFTIAGYLSVLEHDKFERSLPFDLFRADDHHMHHCYVKCNYSPYSAVWDKAFGTHKAFAVKKTRAPTVDGAEGSAGSDGVGAAEPMYNSDADASTTGAGAETAGGAPAKAGVLPRGG